MANMYERLLGDSYKNFIRNYRNVMRLQKKIALLEKGRWMKFTVVLFRKIHIKNCIEVSNVFSERGKECHLQYIIPLSVMNMDMNLCGGIVLFIFIIRKGILMR